MSIENIITTQGAPVSVQGFGSGFNTIWVKAEAGESITVSAIDGAVIVDANGAPANGPFIANTRGWVEPPINIALPAVRNTDATAAVNIAGMSGPVWELALSFRALVQGNGKFRWYGVATGAPAGGEQFCTLFLTIDLSMLVVAVRAASTSVTLPTVTPPSFKGIAVATSGWVSVPVQSTDIGAVCLRCSLPNSADGEMLPVDVNFAPVIG